MIGRDKKLPMEKKLNLQTQPLVSVIVPFYNGKRFIGEAIDSVLNQTYQSLEIIIVDDGSTDDPESAVGPFLSDPRIKLIKHGQNKGISAARNTGIKASGGEFIAFLDQDDMWLPEKLERQVIIFENSPSDVGLVFSNVNTIDDRGTIKEYFSMHGVPSNINSLPPQKVLEALFLVYFIPMVTVLVRRECFGGVGLLDESIKGGADDYDFCLRVAAKYRIKYLNIPLALHRVHGANYSNMERFFYDELRIMEKIMTQEPWLALLKKRKLAILHTRIGKYYLSKGNFGDAWLAFLRAIRYNPLRVRSYLYLLLGLLGPGGDWLLQMYRSIRYAKRLG